MKKWCISRFRCFDFFPVLSLDLCLTTFTYSDTFVLRKWEKKAGAMKRELNTPILYFLCRTIALNIL
jgi:hypothetical protein